MANPGAPQFRHRHTVGQHISQPDDPTIRAQVGTTANADDFGLVVHPGGASAANRISTTSFNSRDAATLAAGATFQGVGEDVSGYGRVGVAFTSTSASDGTLTMEVSHDNVTWGGPTREVSDTRVAHPVMWNIVEQYFRIKYVNGTTEAAGLGIQVQYSNNSDILLGHALDADLKAEHGALLTRSVIAGLQPDGTYANTQLTSGGQLEVSNGGTPEILNNILSEMKLLNARFEEAFVTGINIGDVT